MTYLLICLVFVTLLFFYDYFLYKRLAYFEARIQELDNRYSSICTELNKKIEDHKLETRRIA